MICQSTEGIIHPGAGNLLNRQYLMFWEHCHTWTSRPSNALMLGFANSCLMCKTYCLGTVVILSILLIKLTCIHANKSVITYILHRTLLNQLKSYVKWKAKSSRWRSSWMVIRLGYSIIICLHMLIALWQYDLCACLKLSECANLACRSHVKNYSLS